MSDWMKGKARKGMERKGKKWVKDNVGIQSDQIKLVLGANHIWDDLDKDTTSWSGLLFFFNTHSYLRKNKNVDYL